jgi:molecular chaperone DnaK
MSIRRVALLVGCAAYDDRKFPPLPARHNVGALSLVLADTAIGDFTVDTLLDQPSGTVREQIEGFFADHRRDDLLLLYLSCHGVLDQHRRLHFVSRNTNNGRLDSTGISAQWIKERMDQSRSQRIVLLLDCCYSGAFNRGLTRGGAGAEKIFEQLGGRGRVVITASDKLELAHESEFTDAVVRGLRTGDADRDGDGLVSVYELYQYVHDQVRKNKPDQTPTCSVNEMRGELYLAKNPHTPLPLPDDLAQALKSEIAWMRMVRSMVYGACWRAIIREARNAPRDKHWASCASPIQTSIFGKPPKKRWTAFRHGLFRNPQEPANV